MATSMGAVAADGCGVAHGLDLRWPGRGQRLSTITVVPLALQAWTGNSPGPAAESTTENSGDKQGKVAASKIPEPPNVFIHVPARCGEQTYGHCLDERVEFFAPRSAIIFLCLFHLVSPLSRLHFSKVGKIAMFN